MPAPSNKKKPTPKKQHPKTASPALSPPAPASFPIIQLAGTLASSPHLQQLQSLTSTWLFQDASSDLDHCNIDDLCDFASDEAFENTPLGRLWRRAYQTARKEFDEESKAFYFKGKEKGMEELRSRHETERKEAFLEGYELGKTQGRIDEQEDLYGSTDKPCCHAPVAILEDAEVQTDTIPQSDMAIQVSPPPHTCTASSQTDSPAILEHATIPVTPTFLPTPSFNWADDASSIPICPTKPLRPPPRDLSGLRSTNPHPFGSLAHRGRRSHSFQTRDSRHSRLYQPHRYTTRPLVPFVSHTRPLPPPALSVALNWESDPQLSDLGRALKALGWVRS